VEPTASSSDAGVSIQGALDRGTVAPLRTIADRQDRVSRDDFGKVAAFCRTGARINLGEARRWSHPAITSLNPGTRLPDVPIAVFQRADASGTPSTARAIWPRRAAIGGSRWG